MRMNLLRQLTYILQIKKAVYNYNNSQFAVATSTYIDCLENVLELWLNILMTWFSMPLSNVYDR